MEFRFFVLGVETTTAGMFRDEVRAGPEIVLGRDVEAHLSLADPAVSRRHCRVTFSPDGARVEDLHSRLGTRLNGVALVPGEAVPLREGDELALGPFRVIFVGPAMAEAAETPAEAAMLQALAERPSDSSHAACLVLENGPQAGRRYPLPRDGVIRIGRARECDICIDEARASRLHARLRLHRGEVWLEDAGSRNGTFVGERRIDKAVRLRAEDRLRLGRLRLRLRLPARRISLSAVLSVRPGSARRLWLPSLALLLLGVGGLLLAASV